MGEVSAMSHQKTFYLGVLLDSVSFRAYPAQKRFNKLLSIGFLFLSCVDQPANSWLELMGMLSSLTAHSAGTAADAVVPVCPSSGLGPLRSRSFCAVVFGDPLGSFLVVGPRAARARDLARAGVSPARLVVRLFLCRLGKCTSARR